MYTATCTSAFPNITQNDLDLEIMGRRCHGNDLVLFIWLHSLPTHHRDMHHLPAAEWDARKPSNLNSAPDGHWERHVNGQYIQLQFWRCAERVKDKDKPNDLPPPRDLPPPSRQGPRQFPLGRLHTAMMQVDSDSPPHTPFQPTAISTVASSKRGEDVIIVTSVLDVSSHATCISTLSTTQL